MSGSEETKAHDKTLCVTVQRLSGVLAGYMMIYNQAMDTLYHNMQLQKTKYMRDVILAVTRRILEIKRQLSKLEQSNYQFTSRGLTNLKLTPADVELNEIPEKAVRSQQVQIALEEIFNRIKEEEIRIEEAEAALTEVVSVEEEPLAWWEIDEQKLLDDEQYIEEEEKIYISAEQLEKQRMLNIIIAQEKCRQITQYTVQRKLKRERWIKELSGEAKPPARIAIRVKAATMIQRFMRTYFELKRKKLKDCKRDELLGMRMCKKPCRDQRDKAQQISNQQIKTKIKYETEWKNNIENLKTNYMSHKGEEIKEDYRDEIRSWFQQWYNAIWLIYDIPKSIHGGSVLILKGEVPEPGEWQEQNQLYLEEMKANMKKSPLQRKQDKMAAKRELHRIKRQEIMKKRQEQILLKKMMKNPKMHPGFPYPKSKHTLNILTVIDNYHKDWDELDATEAINVKERSVKEIDECDAYAEVKESLRLAVDDDMRLEQRQLKDALKNEYEMFEEKMPIMMQPGLPKLMNIKEDKSIITENIAQNLVYLGLNGYLKKYPKTNFEDFKGEPNFAGDEQRCNFLKALPYGGETRHIWWERCRELTHGLRKILLVGPKASGKTILINAMASVNDALLFELDPNSFGEETTENDLKQIINKIVVSAKAVQPSVIYIKNIQCLYYTKPQPNNGFPNINMLRKYLTKKITSKLHKNDKISVIASCIDPWLARSTMLLKQFPSVVLMPNTTYTTTSLILREWVSNNRVVPPDFDYSSLARVIQGYSYGYLQNCLESFLTPERIIKIAVRGLSPEEVYNHVIQNEDESKVDYEKYLKWYTEMTHWGRLEQKHLTAQLEFQAVAKKYAEQLKKKKKMQSAASSVANSVDNMRM